MVVVTPSNDAFLVAAREAWRQLGGIGNPVRAFAVSRSDETHFNVHLIDLSSGDPRQLQIVATKRAEHFADSVSEAVEELTRAHGRQPGDEVVLLDQKHSGETNLFRWVLVNPATMDPDVRSNREMAREYRHI